MILPLHEKWLIANLDMMHFTKTRNSVNATLQTRYPYWKVPSTHIAFADVQKQFRRDYIARLTGEKLDSVTADPEVLSFCAALMDSPLQQAKGIFSMTEVFDEPVAVAGPHLYDCITSLSEPVFTTTDFMNTVAEALMERDVEYLNIFFSCQGLMASIELQPLTQFDLSWLKQKFQSLVIDGVM